ARHIQRRPRPLEWQATRPLAVRLEQVALFGEQPRVQVEADGGDMPALRRAKQIASASNLEILHGDAQSSAELRCLEDRLQALLCDFAQRHVLGVEQVGVGAAGASANAPAQL